VILYGSNRWQSQTRELHAGMEAERIALTLESYDLRELERLPAPVQLYFRAVFPVGQPLVVRAGVEHAGTLNMGQNEEQWKPFRSTQRARTQRPGFVWDARIRMAPAMTAYVRDYVAGQGALTAKLFGFLTVMEELSTSESVVEIWNRVMWVISQHAAEH
jgi:hypothetical protein